MNDSIRDNVVVRTDCLRKIDRKNSMIRRAAAEWEMCMFSPREWKSFQMGGKGAEEEEIAYFPQDMRSATEPWCDSTSLFPFFLYTLIE